MNNMLPKTTGFTTRYALIYVLALFLLSTACYSQNDSIPKFGVVDRSALEMKTYAKDTTAAALYLYDYGNVTFQYKKGIDLGVYMVMRCWVRIKILKETALNQRNVSLKYHQESYGYTSQYISNVKGFTHNLEDNEIVAQVLDPESIKIKKVAFEIGSVNFQLPNVKVGSILEYSYTIVTPIKCMERPDTWYFQGQFPYLWSEFQITVPQFLACKIEVGDYVSSLDRQGKIVHVAVGDGLSGDSQYDGPGTNYRFLVKDSPAFVREPFMTSTIDYLSKINFDLMGFISPLNRKTTNLQSWKDFDGDFSSEYKRSNGLLVYGFGFRRVMKDILSQTKDPEEKMQQAYEQVQNKANLYSTENSGKYKRQWAGNSKVNTLLIRLLRALELDCEPLLLSTKSHGRVNKARAGLGNFNYIIAHVKIGEKEFFLDASQPYAPPGLLPESVVNTTGRIIPKEGVGRFVEIPANEILSRIEAIEASIDPEKGRIAGHYNLTYGGYHALRWRNMYVPKQDSFFKEALGNQFPGWQVEDIEIWNKYDFDKTIDINCTLLVSDFDNLKTGLYFNPVLANRVATNPFKIIDRKYPMNLPAVSLGSFTANYRLPKNYIVEELPKSEVISLMDHAGKFTYNVNIKDSVIHVETSVLVNKLTFSPEEYTLLRAFFDQIVEKHAQVIKIKKVVD